MTARVHIAGPSMPLKLLVRLIVENRIGAVPIVDKGGFPIGIVYQSDLLDLQLTGRADAEGAVASNVMIAPPTTTVGDASIAVASRLMEEKSVQHLVVVNAQGRIAGIVTRSDLLRIDSRATCRLA
jgi:CBS domain-containing protein